MEDAKAHLKEHGWIKIPLVLPKEEAQDALDRLWRAKAAFEASGEATFQPILDPNRANVRIFYLPEVDAYWREMLINPTRLDLAKSLLGDQLLVSNFSANIARPGAENMALRSDPSIVLPPP
jgi:hypothetical protein